VRQFFRKPAHWSILFSLAGWASIYLKWWGVGEPTEEWPQPEALISGALFLFVVVWLLVCPRRGGPVFLCALAILAALGLFAVAKVGPALKTALIYRGGTARRP
jgi:hypothetical protein